MARCVVWRCDVSYSMLRTFFCSRIPRFIVYTAIYNIDFLVYHLIQVSGEHVVWVSVCDSPFCRTGAFWLLTFLYSCGCQLYTLLFLANVRKVGGGSRGECHVKVLSLGLSKAFSVLTEFLHRWILTNGWEASCGLYSRPVFCGIHWPVVWREKQLPGWKMQKHGAVPYISRVSKDGGDAT